MAEILRYALVDSHGNEVDEREWDALWQATDAARTRTRQVEPTAVVRRIYVYEEDELVWTPNGSNVWPANLPTRSMATAGGPETTEEQP